MSGKTLFSGRIGRAVLHLYRLAHVGLLVAGMAASAYFLGGNAEWPSFAASRAEIATDAPAVHKERLSREMVRAQNWLSRRCCR